VRVISLGRTFIPDEVIKEYIDDVRPQFNPSTYSLLSHNCNNFSNELSIFLTGHGIPEDIVGLPEEVLSTPFGQMIRPFIEQMEKQQKSMYGTSATLTTPELAAQKQVQQPAATAAAPAPAAASTPAKKVEEQPKESLLATNHSALLSLQRVYKAYVAKLRAGGKAPEAVLSSVEAALSASVASDVKADATVIQFIQDALTSWPIPDCVPVLYLLRELATVPDYGVYLSNNTESLDALCRGLERCGVEAERPAPCLLSMAVGSNLFASAAVAKYLRSSESALSTVFFKTALKNLESKTKSVEQMAAALVFNFTLEPLHVSEQQINGIVNSFCQALCHDSSTAIDPDFEQRCLLAIGHLIQNNKNAAPIVSQSKLHSYLLTRKDARDVPNNADICREICSLLSH